MRSERRRCARQIFEQAIEMPEASHASFLDRACGDDEALMAAVERLLRADAEAEDFLREPLVRGTLEMPSLHPNRVGPYRLREKIGEGGMGAVYRAVRDDDAFDREVAVKLIVHGAISAETHRRLGVERQILATLDHPWIAQIFDGGTTDRGLPYLVMELVDGVPIDAYCEREKLSIRERIELFRKVCAAVHCSHQNLVVHCDLKPSNILVTTAGVPKLLDFGIAKLLSQDALGGRSQPTTIGSRPLTPEYASPEQIQGQALSTASDVYSLGVLLYKLLTGRSPYDLNRESVFAWQQTVCETEPMLPSVVVASGPTVRSLRQSLRGDLDAIVLKALRKVPDERYLSAEHLGEDLRRHLTNEPVRAVGVALRYRLGKLVRRHRLGIGLVAFVLLVAAGLGLEQERQNRRLKAERDRADRSIELLVDLLQTPDSFRLGLPLTACESTLTQTAFLFGLVDRMERQLGNDPSKDAMLLDAIGSIYVSLAHYEDARPILERSHALRLQTADPLALAQSHISLGRLRFSQGDLSEAKLHLDQALVIRESRLGARHVDVASSLVALGDHLHYVENHPAARLHFERALAIYRFHGMSKTAVSLLMKLASLEMLSGVSPFFHEYIKGAIEIQTKELGGDTLNMTHILGIQANYLRMVGDLTAAKTAITKSIEISESIAGIEHPEAISARYSLFNHHVLTGDLAAASSLLTGLAGKVDQHDHPHYPLMLLALIQEHRGETVAAEETIQQTLQMVSGNEHANHSRTRPLFLAASIHLDLGNLGQGEYLFEEALATLSDAGLPAYRAMILRGLGQTQGELGALDTADKTLGQAIAIFEDFVGLENWLTASVLAELGEVRRAQGRYDDAESMLTNAHTILKSQLGKWSPHRTRVRHLLARLYHDTDRDTEAGQIDTRSWAEAHPDGSDIEVAQEAEP